MKSIRVVLVLVLLANTIHRLDSQPAAHNQPVLQEKSRRDEKSVIKFLQSALARTGSAARIYFHGTCDVNPDGSLQFPAINIVPLSGDEVGVAAVQEMFRNDKDVMVTSDTPGVIRIVIGSVSRTILDTRLPSLRLTKTAQYNPGGPGGAIDAFESTAAVQAAMRESKVHQESDFYIGLEQPVLARLPHLRSSIKDMTVDQALDSIAKTFPGVVVYGECARPDNSHTIDLWFDWLPSVDRDYLNHLWSNSKDGGAEPGFSIPYSLFPVPCSLFPVFCYRAAEA